MTFSTSQLGLTLGVTALMGSGIWTATSVVASPSQPCGTETVSRV